MSGGINYTRIMARYSVLRAAGVDWKVARKKAQSAAAFVEALAAAGGDPAKHPDLARKLQSGPPRSGKPGASERAKRYQALKDLGVPPILASRYSQGKGLMQRALYKLEKGLPL